MRSSFWEVKKDESERPEEGLTQKAQEIILAEAEKNRFDHLPARKIVKAKRTDQNHTMPTEMLTQELGALAIGTKMSSYLNSHFNMWAQPSNVDVEQEGINSHKRSNVDEDETDKRKRFRPISNPTS